MRITILAVPFELEDMKMEDMMKVVAKMLPGCMISYLPSTKKVKDFLPMEFTIHEGNILDSLIMLTQLGFMVKRTKGREFNPLLQFTIQ